MTKSELIERIACVQHQLSAKDVELAVKMMLDQMAEALADGDRIEIRGFGQQGNLGRYEVLLYFRHIICKIYRSSLTASLYSFVLIGTLYFHMSGSVDGNVWWTT